MKQVRSDEARRTFRDILNDVEHQGEHVEILRYKTPAVVIVPIEWYVHAKAALKEGEQQ
jgi:antitoxin (DNA-binding transcriptional repressor) of toxin-antitoxin stability system